MGGARCHPKCERRWRDLDIEEGRGLCKRRLGPSLGVLVTQGGCDTLCPARCRAATDVRINARTTVPAVSTSESRQSVTGESVTQALKRAVWCWAFSLTAGFSVQFSVQLF